MGQIPCGQETIQSSSVFTFDQRTNSGKTPGLILHMVSQAARSRVVEY